jgi:hypothetical protein
MSMAAEPNTKTEGGGRACLAFTSELDDDACGDEDCSGMIEGKCVEDDACGDEDCSGMIEGKCVEDACGSRCSRSSLATSPATCAPTCALFSISLTSKAADFSTLPQSRSLVRLTQLEGRASRQLPDALQQPRRHLLAPHIDTLLYALQDSLLDGHLHFSTSCCVLGRDGNSEKGAERGWERERGV